MGGLQLFFYISSLVFVLGVASRTIRIARMPLHLRWDLYPIPHERGKEHYGGSYYEEVEWWTKPQNTTLLGELKEMAREIFFIHSLYRNNRPLWIFSFPFHAGLYLSVLFVLLIFTGALFGIAGVVVSAQSVSVAGLTVYYLTLFTGLPGALLAGFGALGLFLSRMFTTELRKTSTWTDYFSLVLLFVIFITTLVVWRSADPQFESTRAFVASLVSFQPAGGLPALITVHFTLAALFLLWLPFTHMTHFVGKFFTYHRVRWEDQPNRRGSRLESAVTQALSRKITWSAPHIRSGGTWAEAATDTISEQEKKDA